MVEDAPQMLQVEVPCDPEAAATVRESMAELDDLGWVIGDAMLVASELVTNAVVHSGCDPEHDIEVQVYWDHYQEAIRISVRDPGHSGRAATAGSSGAEVGSGLGLVIVDALSRRWGTERDGGYHVWAELPAA